MKAKPWIASGTLLITLFCLAFAGCGEGPDADTTSNALQDDVPAAISIDSANDTINPGQSTTIKATVYDSGGNTLPDIQILFSLSDPRLAYLNRVASTAADGSATVVLTARQLSGTLEVSAIADGVTSEEPKKIVILDETTPMSIALSINPSRIVAQGTASITATVLDVNGNAVQNGTTVFFEIANPAYGEISETALTNNGLASATFEANNQPGQTTIQASSGAIVTTIDLEILPAETASIQFVSAEPQVIAIKDSGGNDSAIIKFLVNDSNGVPQAGIPVLFEMTGPNGGEIIDASGDGTPGKIEVASNGTGIAQVILQSGYVAGPVTINATIDILDSRITVKSSVVSIGGGTPSARRFSATSKILNLPGLAFDGRTTDVYAYLSDRYGNYNVLSGTTVSFVSEQGLAIDTSAVSLSEDGIATVTVRTQGRSAENVTPASWETQLTDYIYSTYGFTTLGHPRDGLVSILVYTKGEEHFDDTNANGIYDINTDVFKSDYDTVDDPFCDYNDNLTYDDVSSNDPDEIWIDANQNSSWDDTNGIWDSNKYIFSNLKVLITGTPLIAFDQNTFDVANGSSELIRILICDQNLNQLPPDTKISISSNNGTLSGQTSYTLYNANAVGPDFESQRNRIEFPVIISDEDIDETDPAQTATLTVTVNWEGEVYTQFITGTID